MKPVKFIAGIFMVAFIWACSGDTSEIESLYQEEDVSQELITDVVISYSDSARVRLKVNSPLMKRREIDAKIVEEFPKGLFVEFYEGHMSPQSWLKADRATRYPESKKIIVKGNVELYNIKKDKLESAELIWDEENQEISTEKFVRITQPEK